MTVPLISTNPDGTTREISLWAGLKMLPPWVRWTVLPAITLVSAYLSLTILFAMAGDVRHPAPAVEKTAADYFTAADMPVDSLRPSIGPAAVNDDNQVSFPLLVWLDGRPRYFYVDADHMRADDSVTEPRLIFKDDTISQHPLRDYHCWHWSPWEWLKGCTWNSVPVELDESTLNRFRSEPQEQVNTYLKRVLVPPSVILPAP